ncbi:MAG: multicopper oxidase domain-containing protein [Myxococcota bacterium]|nr:multicopper oxidase domain-containing protein [Myxococcota bacterium]
MSARKLHTRLDDFEGLVGTQRTHVGASGRLAGRALTIGAAALLWLVAAAAGPAMAGKFKIPTGASPSPLFDVEPFTQKMMRFEEFGTLPLPHYKMEGGSSLPVPKNTWSGPDHETLDDFLYEPIYPYPTRTANMGDGNPWQKQVEESLGRSLNYTAAEGRPPGEAFAHQRWNEFYPEVYFQTATTGARTNGGLRDDLQMHGFSAGEFGPDGLYYSQGTSAGTEVRLHPDMPLQDPDAVWTFDGTLPPKLLQARYGETVLFRHYNALPVDPSANYGFGLHTLSTHEHNGHNPFESDGYMQAFFFPGQYYDYRWPMILAGHDSINTDASNPMAGAPDGQGGITRVRGDYRETMSTHWFHDHMLDYTAQNVYKGSAAMMNYYSAIDRGNEGLVDGINLRLPSGTALDWGNRDYDMNLLMADKAWDEDGQLYFNIFNRDGFLGDQMTVNWQYKPFVEVRARSYRFRLLNGSVSRYLKLALVDEEGEPVPFYMIANDGNIMEHSIYFEDGQLPTQSIAERYDIIVDFSAFEEGDRLYLVNLLEHRNGKGPKAAISLSSVVSDKYDGDPAVGKFLEFRVKAYKGKDLSMNPADYVEGAKKMIPLPTFTEEELANARHRSFKFGRSNGTDSAPWTIKTDGGQGLGADPSLVSAAPDLGSVEIWHLESSSGGWAHPVHIHFEEGQILTKDGQEPPAWEKWSRKDVYRLGPEADSANEMAIAIRFREFGGTYMEHCHNTQHEDHAMLLRWDIEKPGQLVSMATPMPEWEGCGYIETEELSTYKSGDTVAKSLYSMPAKSSILKSAPSEDPHFDPKTQEENAEPSSGAGGQEEAAEEVSGGSSPEEAVEEASEAPKTKKSGKRGRSRRRSGKGKRGKNL